MDLGRALVASPRRGVLLLAATLLGLLAGIGATALLPPTYRAHATVLFTLKRVDGFVTDLAEADTYVQDLAPSYAALVREPLVLSPVITELGLRTTAADLASRIRVVLPAQSAILTIVVDDRDGVLAARIADSVARHLRAALVELSAPDGTELASVVVTTVSPAAIPTGPVSPRISVGALGGLLLGLLSGLGALTVRHGTSGRRLADPWDVAEVTDLPLLGGIADDPESLRRPLPVSTHPTIPRAEDIRTLRLRLATSDDRPVRHLALVSPRSGDGRSTTAASLAIAFAQSSRRVLLVEADLRRPWLQTLLQCHGPLGLPQVLAGTADLAEAVQAWQAPDGTGGRLDVLTGGPPVADPGQLLQPPALTALLADATARYDTIVVDTAPLLLAAEAAVVARAVDAVMIVVDGPRTTPADLTETVRRLTLTGVAPLGVLVNRAVSAAAGAYGCPPASDGPPSGGHGSGMPAPGPAGSSPGVGERSMASAGGSDPRPRPAGPR
jgi:succinoglycan biosynthesis transport protein ExoP